MLRRIFVAIAAFALLMAPSIATASLTTRVTAYTGAGVGIASSSATVPTSFQGFGVSVGGFTVVLTTNIATSGGSTTSHTETIGLTYSGAVGSPGTSEVLVVEFFGDNYNSPPPGLAFISSNASPSSEQGQAAATVNMISGVISGALPAASFAAPATLGTTSGTGLMTPGASTVLAPNPAISAPFALPANFGFYQRFTFSNFSATGSGSLSAASTLSNVPEPASMAIWSLIGGIGAVAGWRRSRRKA